MVVLTPAVSHHQLVRWHQRLAAVAVRTPVRLLLQAVRVAAVQVATRRLIQASRTARPEHQAKDSQEATAAQEPELVSLRKEAAAVAVAVRQRPDLTAFVPMVATVAQD